MDQDGIILSKRKIHSPNSYTAEFSNKYYETGTLHVNVSDLYNMVMSEEDNMMHVLGLDMIQTFSLKKGLKKFGAG